METLKWEIFCRELHPPADAEERKRSHQKSVSASKSEFDEDPALQRQHSPPKRLA